MTIGAFAVVAVVAGHGDDEHALADYRGLARRQPVLAGLLTLFLLAQAGVPLTGGFVAKLSVFSAAVDAGQYWLALIGMLAAVDRGVRLPAHHPRDVRAGRRRGAARRRPCAPVSTTAPRIALAVAAAAVLFLGIMPGGMLDFAQHATQLLAVSCARRRDSSATRHARRRRSGSGGAARRGRRCGGDRGRGRAPSVRRACTPLDQLARAGEVEQVARVGRAGEHDHLDRRAARSAARARSAGCARA